MKRSINSPSTWTGKDLAGEWQVTLKIDGVRAIWHEELGWQSRANKPLYNIPPWQPGQARDCELYVHSFRDTIIASRTRLPHSNTPSIRQQHLYGLDRLDPRLHYAHVVIIEARTGTGQANTSRRSRNQVLCNATTQ